MDRNIPTFLVPFIGLLAGSAFGLLWIGDLLWSLIPISVGIAFAVMISFGSKNPSAAARLNACHYLWIFLLFSGVGMASGFMARPERIPDDILNERLFITGEVMECDTKTRGDSYIIKVDRMYGKNLPMSCHDNLKVLVVTDGATYEVGDIVNVGLNLSEISSSPLSTSFADYMNRRGIYYRGYVRDVDGMEMIGTHYSVRRAALDLRDRIEILIEKSSLDRKTISFVIALMCGDRSFLSGSDISRFADAGGSHGRAVSGMHVGILSVILLWMLFPLNLMGNNRARFVITVAILWIFVFITGMAPSTVRATVMATCCFMALFLQRKNSSLNALLVAGFIIVLVSPLSLFDAGAQLSFMCVACLILFADKFNTVDHHRHPRLYKLNSIVIASLVASMGTWALSAFHFHRLPLMFLPVNIIIVPLLPFLMAMSVAYVLMLAIGLDIPFMAHCLDISVESIFGFITFISSDNAIDISISSVMTALWVVAVLLLGVAVRMSRRVRVIASAVSVVMMAVVATDVVKASVQPPARRMMVGKEITRISVTVENRGSVGIINFLSGKVSRLKGDRLLVVAVDRKVKSGEWSHILGDSSDCLIIIGRGFKGELPEKGVGGRNICAVVHTSFRKSKERSLIEALVVRGIDAVSLRSTPSFAVIL